MNLFVLVSTGQRVANLPPVLEIAQPGDQILWIESEEASQRNWTVAPRAVLEGFGLTTVKVIRLVQVNDPSLLVQTLSPFAQSHAHQYKAIYLVTNGGTKHTPIGLLNAFRDHNPRLLYGDERPAVYSIFPPGLNAPPQMAPYVRHRLDLRNILNLNGYTFATGTEPQQIYPASLAEAILRERYGADETYTYDLHTQHHNWASVSGQTERVRFEEIRDLVPNHYERWEKNLRLSCQAMTFQNLCNSYNSTLNLSVAACHAANQRASRVPAPSARIGDSLERAVARRVHRWLEQNPHPAVQSVWTGVRIARENNPNTVEAEFDILIVLKNGILFHLECKSANVESRALDVNTHRLQRAGSQLARSAVVVPIFTQCANSPWFRALHNIKLRLTEQLGPQSVLPFTWPNQPEEYTVANSEQRETFTCRSFETGLSDLLRSYRP